MKGRKLHRLSVREALADRPRSFRRKFFKYLRRIDIGDRSMPLTATLLLQIHCNVRHSKRMLDKMQGKQVRRHRRRIDRLYHLRTATGRRIIHRQGKLWPTLES